MKEKNLTNFSILCVPIIFPKDNSTNPQLKAILYSHWSNGLQVTAPRSREYFLSNHNE